MRSPELRPSERPRTCAGSREPGGLIAALLPKNTALPSIGGTLLDGSSLTSSTGTWSGTSPTYSYQWQLCNSSWASCSNVSGATASVLSLVSADVGSTVRMVVTATNSAGSTSATSEPSGLIAALLPKNTALPSITGLLKIAQLLTAVTGTWTGTAPITYSYQWELCNLLGKGECKPIAGATGSTYVVALLDAGLPLRVTVTVKNAAGSVSTPSKETGLIELLKLAPIAGPSGTTVSISAPGVSAATAVHFGSAETSEVEVKSPTEITAQAPPGSGTVPVTVTVLEGTTAANPADQFSYR